VAADRTYAPRNTNVVRRDVGSRENARLGEVALVLRVPKEAVAYIDSRAGDRRGRRSCATCSRRGIPRLAKVLSALGRGDSGGHSST